MEETVLFLHLLGVLLFVAGIVVAGVAFETARRREQPPEIALLLGLARVGAVLVASGALLLFVCGLWLVGLEDVGFGTGWVAGGDRALRRRAAARRLRRPAPEAGAQAGREAGARGWRG